MPSLQVVWSRILCRDSRLSNREPSRRSDANGAVMRDITYRLSINPSPWTCIKREAAQEIDALRKKIAALTAERDRLLSCDGCVNAPTEAEPNYHYDCMSCRRFYGDLYEGKNK